jgi:hypothetical protein
MLPDRLVSVAKKLLNGNNMGLWELLWGSHRGTIARSKRGMQPQKEKESCWGKVAKEHSSSAFYAVLTRFPLPSASGWGLLRFRLSRVRVGSGIGKRPKRAKRLNLGDIGRVNRRRLRNFAWHGLAPPWVLAASSKKMETRNLNFYYTTWMRCPTRPMGKV